MRIPSKEKPIEAQVTISRDSSDVMRLSVVDRASGVRFFEAQFTLADFMMALTGLANVSAKSANVVGLEHVGKFKVSERRSVLCPLKSYDRDKLEGWLKEQQEPGWIVDSYLGSQGSMTRPLMEEGTFLHYRVFKYVDKDPKAVAE